MKISVLTPTIRSEGLVYVKDGLDKQTMSGEFEWLVEVNYSNKPDLNRAYNKMLKRAKGELIVFLQDYITIQPNGLEQFWLSYQEGGKKHQSPFTTSPVGKVKRKEHISGSTWTLADPEWDWRGSRYGEIEWNEWEIDWGAAPKWALFEIGGFDEELDHPRWGFDNVNVGLRASLAGYKFYNLQDNKATGLDHDEMMAHPFRSMRDPDFHNERLEEFRRGLQIDYLSTKK